MGYDLENIEVVHIVAHTRYRLHTSHSVYLAAGRPLALLVCTRYVFFAVELVEFLPEGPYRKT